MRKLKAVICLVIVVLMMGTGTFAVFFFARDGEDKKIVVTIFPIYDICREILGDDEDILLLEDNGVDMHSFRPTASDIASISKSELFIHIGGESDAWVDGVLRSANNVNMRTLTLIDSIEKIEEGFDGIIDTDHEHEHEHQDGQEHEETIFDEHIWLSIKNMKKMTESILDELIIVFPHMQELLKENAENYISSLNRLDEEYGSSCANQISTLVVADRFPFVYLSRDYDIDFVAAFHGCSTDTEASVQVISSLINQINSEELNYICILENANHSIANSVISDSNCRQGVQILVLDSCQSVSKYNLENLSYIEIMTKNLENIKKAINNETN